MLTNTFIHIQGIGAKTEQRLWNSGFREWDALYGDLPTPIPAGRKFFLQKGIEESRRHLANFNPAYFSRLIPSNQGWRMFPVNSSLQTGYMKKILHLIKQPAKA